MAQVVVRGLEEEVKEGLKRRAKRHGRSMEDEVRHILRKAAREQPRPVEKLGSRIAARFKGKGLAVDVVEWRGHRPQPPDFER